MLGILTMTPTGIGAETMSQDIETLLKAAIQTKVIEAFNTTPEMVEKMVRAAFEKKVGEQGMPSTGRYGEKEMPFIDWLVGEEIRKAASEAVRDYMTQHREAVKAKVVDAMQKGDYGGAIGEQFAKVMEQEWNWSFHIKTKGDEA